MTAGPDPVAAAMAQMRAWLADGTISLEQIMSLANVALNEIERTGRKTDPESWMDAHLFVERMNAMASEGDEYGPSSIKVLEGMEPPRPRPAGNIGGTTEEYDHFARQVGFATDESFIGRELIENWDHELMLAVDKIGPNFLYDRTAAEILQVAGLIALSLAGHFQLEIKKDRELTNIEAAWYLGSYPVLVTRHIEAGSLKSLRLSDLAPFKIEQDRVARLITEINDELAFLDEDTDSQGPGT